MMANRMAPRVFEKLKPINLCSLEAGMSDRLLKGGDVDTVLGISRSLAYRMMRTGEIQSIRFGRTIRVRPEALERFLQERTMKNGLQLK
jgi:excisionase family DNA binding protein